MKRRKITRSRTKNIHGFNSVKSENHFRVESGLEFEACYHLEFSDHVASYEAQPLGYEYNSFGKAAKYTPDFKLQYTDSKPDSFLEVKCDTEAEHNAFQDIFTHKKEGSEQRGISLSLFQGKDIRREPLLSNLKILYKYRTNDPLNEKHYLILDVIGQYEQLTIKQIPSAANLDKKHCYPLVYDLLARKKLEPYESLEKAPLNSHSVVRIGL